MTTPILLIPGLNCSGHIFARLAPELWRFGPVMVADHRTGETMAEIAAAILADAPPRFVLGGYSMGGYIAFEILRQAPERVTRLILMDTQAAPDTPEQSGKRRDGITLAGQGRYETLLATRFPFIVHADNTSDRALRRAYLDMAIDLGPEAFIRHSRAIISRKDSRPGLSGIGIPTLILVGEADQVTPVAESRKMAREIKGAELVSIPGAGHLAPLEQPAAYNAAICDWLSQ